MSAGRPDRYPGSAEALPERRKLPGAVAFCLLGAAAAVFGGVTGQWGLTILGGTGAACFVIITVMLLLGRKPWWMRSPLDPPHPPSGNDHQ
jgi:uncharacterized membrane protein YdfJ with MMPL/SSD domain